MGPADVKEGKALPQRSLIGSGDPSAPTGGFMLLDLALALTILLLVFAIAWPSLGRGTSSAQHLATALDIAILLRVDRSLATGNGTARATRIDVSRRLVTSASGRQIRVPGDLALQVTTTAKCVEGQQRFMILFAPDGSSCGGLLVLSKGEQALAIRINWLSGMIDVLPLSRS